MACKAPGRGPAAQADKVDAHHASPVTSMPPAPAESRGMLTVDTASDLARIECSPRGSGMHNASAGLVAPKTLVTQRMRTGSQMSGAPTTKRGMAQTARPPEAARRRRSPEPGADRLRPEPRRACRTDPPKHTVSLASGKRHKRGCLRGGTDDLGRPDPTALDTPSVRPMAAALANALLLRGAV